MNNVTTEGHGTLPLGLLATGDRAEVASPFGGAGQRGDAMGRLEEMGLRPGAWVEVLANEGHGPVLLKVGESRIAVGRGIAMRVAVRMEPSHGAGSCGGCHS